MMSVLPPLSPALDALRAHVLEHSVKRGNFTLKSGAPSSWFLDTKQTACRPDGILLVVRLGHTPRYYVEQTNNALEALGGNVLGTCLTGANITDTSSHYPKQR